MSEIRRVEMPALHLGADPMHGTGTKLAAAVQQDGDLLQEGVAAVDAYRPSGSHHGVELGIGEAERHGSPHCLRNTGARL